MFLKVDYPLEACPDIYSLTMHLVSLLMDDFGNEISLDPYNGDVKNWGPFDRASKFICQFDLI